MSVPLEIIAAAAASAAKANKKALDSLLTIWEAEFEEHEAFYTQLKKLGFTRDDLSTDEMAIFKLGGFPQPGCEVDCTNPISLSDALKLAEAEVGKPEESEYDENFQDDPESLTPQKKLFAGGRNDEATKSGLPPLLSGRKRAEHSAPGEYNRTSDCRNSVAATGVGWSAKLSSCFWKEETPKFCPSCGIYPHSSNS